MIYVTIRHAVGDYRRWKESFDIHAAARQAGGATGEVHVMRNLDAADEITVLLGWRDLHQARAFTQSVSLQEALQQAGVVGLPEVRFCEKVE